MSKLDFVGADLSRHLEEIAEHFKNPKVTLLVRSPDLPDGDLILTDDDLSEAVKAIERLRDRGKVPA